ncbi:DNA-directed RNA polymerase, alpha subunit [Mycobacterium ulcerans str. Harvey]|uniref:DNA-directed RNA polymerase, alpha subunit n=1 Tax=Mycobacterium ulcerans str. Harvey TaxID=1299332 RepID=A0ABN0R4X6_MYCUL|nr:DNA-directed RNA polymerase, alpha subunit [Mycobacterium ulcerans str. Harvey]
MLISQRPTLSEEVLTDSRSQFVIEPLEPGFGYTLGNSLRRTLLSSIPGAAVTSIRIDGVLHEFTTVPGVKEDVTDIILNLKALVVSSEEDEPVTMYLRKQGPGEVTAGDIVPPAGVTVHNPNMRIATLNDKGKLEVELVVERGRGYVPAVQNRASGAEIGRIPVDSIYSPVLKVTYKVDATRVEQRTDFDKLILDVETKNSITRATRWHLRARRSSNCSVWHVNSTSRPKVSRLGRRRPRPTTSPRSHCRSTTWI